MKLQTPITSYLLIAFFAAIICSCSSKDETYFVREGNIYFDDAMARLSPLERQRFENHGIEEIRGFLFRGEAKSCIVIFSLRDDIISHSPDPAFCYDNETNAYLERL
jgi:hypothetical protein